MAAVSTLGAIPRAPVMKADSRVLVTGGTGFIGSHFIDALVEQGVRPRVLVRRTSDTSRLSAHCADLVVGSLEDAASLARAVSEVEIVFHLAAVTKARTEREYYCANADGTQALVDAMRAADPRPRRLVYLSSLAAAGPALNGQPVEPDHEPHPITAYGRSKLVGEHVCLAAADTFDVVALRAPIVYGPRERDFFLLFRLAARGVFLRPTGPDRIVQLVHVTDLVRALMCGATMPGAGGIYHVADSQPYAWSEVAACIGQAVGRSVHMVRIPQFFIRLAAAASEIGAAIIGRATIFNREKVSELLAPGWLCETALAKQGLGFEAQIPLSTGFAETVAWYKRKAWL